MGIKKLSLMGTMNIILILVALMLLSFTIVMIYLFKTYGNIPDTLCTCVFAVLGTECGAMAWIKTAKEKYRRQEYTKEAAG